MTSNYALVMLSLAAKACLKDGMNRQRATLEFMAAFDVEREKPQGSCSPPPIKLPPIGSPESVNEVVAVTSSGGVVVALKRRISSMRPPPEEPIK